MLCKKTNGFELISPGKFDFSTRRPAGRHRLCAATDGQHALDSYTSSNVTVRSPAGGGGVVGLMALPAGLRLGALGCFGQNAPGIGLTTFGP